VTINDIKHELNGFESVEYINNSPTLSDFYISISGLSGIMPFHT